MQKLIVLVHLFYFNDGTYVKWTPVNKDGKAKGLFDVSIEFPAAEAGSDIIRSQHQGPPSAKSSLHWLKWAKNDRAKKAANKDLINQ